MQNWTISSPETAHFTFVLFERFSNQILANAVEPLRAANTILAQPVYSWDLVSLDGSTVTSSAGMRVVPDGPLLDTTTGAGLILLPSYGFRAFSTPEFGRKLRSAARRYNMIMGIDGGAWLMAAAGLLDDRRATIHFDEFERFAEAFPNVDTDRARWVDDGDRLTAGGAVAVFELMTHLLVRRHGTALSLRIAALFAVPGAAERHPMRQPRIDRKMRTALATMEANIETPLRILEIAQAAGCTQKDLERRFARAFGASPRTVYQRMRLDAARTLIEGTAFTLTEIAARTGYTNAAAVSRAFRATFGLAPREVRALAPPTNPQSHIPR